MYVSIIVPTKDRPNDLRNLLLTLLNLRYRPIEIIIVDDSRTDEALKVIQSLKREFEKHDIKVYYVKGDGEGLTSARNMGLSIANGDIICFLDDDVLILDPNAIDKIVEFFTVTPEAMCVQPFVIHPHRSQGIRRTLGNAVRKALCLDYRSPDKCEIRRCYSSVFPSEVRRVVKATRVMGCAFCCRSIVFKYVKFDTYLKKAGYYEDADFSSNVIRTFGKNSINLIPFVIVYHKVTPVARLSTEQQVNMSITYWTYTFLKNQYNSSILNLIAFLYALCGMLIHTVLDTIVGRKKSSRELVSLLKSYIFVLTTLRKLRKDSLQTHYRETQLPIT